MWAQENRLQLLKIHGRIISEDIFARLLRKITELWLSRRRCRTVRDSAVFRGYIRNVFFDVGIAEQHAVTFAAALAKSGQVPVFAVYSTFLQRGYDQMLHDTALQNAHVVFAIDRSGPVGDDGETHQGVYDLSYLLHMPNMKVFSPSNELDLREILSYAVNVCNGPVAIRYPRGMITEFKDIDFLSYNRSPLKPNIVVDDGGDLDAAILSVGVCLNDSLKAARALQEKGKKIAVIDIKGVKPIDIKNNRRIYRTSRNNGDGRKQCCYRRIWRIFGGYS